MNTKIVTMILICVTLKSSWACTILTSSEKSIANNQDAITRLLTMHQDCPKDAIDFRKQIRAANLKIKTTMVANRGYHNPSLGSFSFFEMVTGTFNSLPIQKGDFFFGHFTTVDDNNELSADQGITEGNRLIVEAFAWDDHKKLFNFYELVGDGTNNQWFYRGDSADIYADNALLHRQPDPKHPQFGNRLRCSGCHGSGGPIMKEIDAPHNDWWEPIRQLDLGGRHFSRSLTDVVEDLVSSEQLAENVLLGLQKLENSKADKGLTLSFQEKLRPLFCPVEINLMSDNKPNNESNPDINIPIPFFINPVLTDNQIGSISIPRSDYEYALTTFGSSFPETSLSDADHAWLSPVKAASDQLAIHHLIDGGLIDEKFAYDVLSLDYTNPVFSDARCGLLKYVPITWSNDWKGKFTQNLKASDSKNAHRLLEQLNNPSNTPAYYKKRGNDFLKLCIEQLKDKKNSTKLFLLLIQRRAEIKASELSKNKRGQILEPGFRVIFPVTNIVATPGKLVLSENCEIESSP